MNRAGPSAAGEVAIAAIIHAWEPIGTDLGLHCVAASRLARCQHAPGALAYHMPYVILLSSAAPARRGASSSALRLGRHTQSLPHNEGGRDQAHYPSWLAANYMRVTCVDREQSEILGEKERCWLRLRR